MKARQQGYSWLHPALTVRVDSALGGQGIFTTKQLPQDTVLAILRGHVMRVEDEPVFPGGRRDLAVQLHDEFVLGAKFAEELEDADCFNHSCNPNAGIHGQIFVVALRDILPREQVCFDYAMVLNLPAYRMDCLCGAPNCRKVVTGEDWKLPELQQRYDGYFQWYLQEKINRLRTGTG